jgi:hypothetical protein
MADLAKQDGKPPALDPNDPLDRIAMESMTDEAAREQADADFLNPPSEEPAIDPAQTWAQIPFMFGKLLGMAMPELRPVYNEEACLAWGVGMAAVSDKYGWDAGETIAKWGPEIALVVATLPLAVPTYHAIKARQEAKERAEAARERERTTVDINQRPNAPSGPMDMEPGNFSEPH